MHKKRGPVRNPNERSAFILLALFDFDFAYFFFVFERLLGEFNRQDAVFIVGVEVMFGRISDIETTARDTIAPFGA